jgi:nucleosome binding factor SPN SPT16 subunit
MPAFHIWGTSWEYPSQLLLLYGVSNKANIESKKKPAAIKQSGIFVSNGPQVITLWTPVVVS